MLAGIRDITPEMPMKSPPTFVPFRDSGQEDLVAEDKTRRLFEMDLARLRRTVLLVSYIDGLAKDEGICFEIGYAYATGAAILLISTDFFEVGLPNGQAVALDPLLHATATHIIRRPRLVESAANFTEMLTASRRAVLGDVRESVAQLLSRPARQPITAQPSKPPSSREVLVDFGGFVYEWQTMLYDELTRQVGSTNRVRLTRTLRYDASLDHDAPNSADLDLLAQAAILLTCTDSDEAAAGTSVLQGMMCALGRPIWMYNSKRTTILAPGGYRSSRNLMLDYSATRTFRSINDLATALREL